MEMITAERNGGQQQSGALEQAEEALRLEAERQAREARADRAAAAIGPVITAKEAALRSAMPPHMNMAQYVEASANGMGC